MIQINDFNNISKEEKVNELWKNGTFLTCRLYGDYVIELYSLNNFFVELWYDDMAGTDKLIMQLKCFKDINLIQPYFDEELSFRILKNI